jgi:hypothetical protein
MKYITLRESFIQAINENTAIAKQYVIKRAAKRLEKEPEALTDAERKKALESPAIAQIFELTKDHANYSLPFLRFYFEHRAPIKSPEGEPDAPSLEYLMNIIRTKKQMLAQLEHNFDYYASLKPENSITGFEKLTDALRTLERAKESKWFIDRLPRALRDQYRALPKDEQSRVINLAIQLKEIGDEAIGRLFDKIKAFSSWKIQDVIDYSSNYVKGYSNLGLRKKIAEIESLEPEAGIIYIDNQYLVLSVRTEKSQKELCSIANWCINRGSFSGYAKDAVQLNIFNFGTDPSDPLFLTGTTIYYNGTVRTSHDINDAHILKSTDPVEHLLALGYPQILVDSVMQQFPTEVGVKKIVYDLKIDAMQPEELFKIVIQQSYKSNFDQGALEIIYQILDSRIKRKISRKEIVQLYSRYGVLSTFSAQLLKFLLEDVTVTEMKPIIDSTVAIFKKMHSAAKILKTLPQPAQNVLSQEKEIRSELGILN